MMLMAVAVACSVSAEFDGCPGEQQRRNVTLKEFGTIYSTQGARVGITFNTSDSALQAVYDKAVECELNNVHLGFLPGLDVVVEGAGYKNVWLETQPMAGAMWTLRNVTQALANQLVFMRTAREDGRLPGMVVSKDGPILNAVYCIGTMSLLQGDYFSTTSVDVGQLLNASVPGGSPSIVPYLQELHTVLEAFDEWMWRARRGSGMLNDTLWCPSSADWGGDGFDGYDGYQPPFTSMDMMGYAHSNALALNRTSTLLGNRSGIEHWDARAATIRNAFKRVLWNESAGACYDIDANGTVVDVLMHNNLRAMWHNVLDQDMANKFVQRHLRNQDEFWTPFPLPSIAANDKEYHPGIPRNDWSGPAEGLTYQRAIRALENYGYHSEVSLLGIKLMAAIEKSMTFPQQWNPKLYEGIPAGTADHGDCYGPALISALEYVTYAHGVKPRPSDGHLLWSSLTTASTGEEATPVHVSKFSQTLGDDEWISNVGTDTFAGFRGHRMLFNATRGIRVVTDAEGHITGVVGIASETIRAKLSFAVNGQNIDVYGDVVPNTEYRIESEQLIVERQVPFIKPSAPTGWLQR